MSTRTPAPPPPRVFNNSGSPTLTLEYKFTDKSGQRHAGTIRNVPNGRMTHTRLSRLAALWADAAPAEWDKLDCYSQSARAKALRARMAANRADARAAIAKATS